MTNRIILIEDQITDIQQRLGQLGYQVIAKANNAEMNISLIHELSPDLIIIDMDFMGEKDLVEATKRIPTCSNIPFILLVPSKEVQTIARAHFTTLVPCLIKPIKDDQLDIAIQVALSSYQLGKDSRKSEESYKLAMDATDNGIWDWDLKTNELTYSPRWKTMLGYSEEEKWISLEEWLKRIHPDDRKQFEGELATQFNGTSHHLEYEYRMMHSNGGVVWIQTKGLIIRDNGGAVIRMVGTQSDISTRKLAEDRLTHYALHDALTGLPNRVLFMDRLTLRFNRIKRYPDELFGVLFLDIDRFKVVNDSLGHDTGDELLITIARRIQKCLRPEDTVSRLSGDEFAILLSDVKSVEDLVRVSDRIRSSLIVTTLLGSIERSLTASIGIVLFNKNYEKPEEILRDADLAMFRAKSLGRNRHQVFDTSMLESAVALIQMEGDLKRAVDHHEWQVLYQPIVSVVTGKTIGLEALLRWQHPQLGTVMPLEFIPVAEESGYIISIGEYVLREACSKVKIWRESGQPDLWVAVNLSAKQFHDPNLVDRITQILAEVGLASNGLRLEVTESVAMVDSEYTVKILRELQKIGVFLILDDFGTGYSSLNYLQRFPIKMLKIDQSFVRDIQINKNSEAIITAINTMAKSCNMEVVAEGVEKIEQSDFLRFLLCDNLQGFFICVPLTDQELSDKFSKIPRKND